jgi:allantoinase
MVFIGSESSMMVVKSRKVLLSDGSLSAKSLLVENGKISAIGEFNDNFSQSKVLDFGDCTLSPGLVDTHAHINEPGRTEWEGFVSATRSAAAGGITTVIDMPLNSIPATTTLPAFETKRNSARSHCAIDYGFWGGVVPGNQAELEPMIQAGIMGFKCFLCPSGVDEFPHVSAKDLEIAMPILTKHKIPLLVHAELEAPCQIEHQNPQDYRSYLESRPDSWERQAIAMMIELAGRHKTRTHIVHLSTAKALPDIETAQKKGIPITAETCPHYLVLEAEKILNKATHFKCAPPIRDHQNREHLWEGIRRGLIEFIVSDHSPCVPGLKLMESGDFLKAWGGISGLQFSLSAVWTEMQSRGFQLSDLQRLMSMNTAKILGLEKRKGQISPGFDADFVLWQPQERFEVKEAGIYHRHKVSPYLGHHLSGKIYHTFVRGQMVYDNGKFLEQASGKELLREKAWML